MPGKISMLILAGNGAIPCAVDVDGITQAGGSCVFLMSKALNEK